MAVKRCKIGIKNEVKTSYFGDHIRTWTVISKKKKVFTLFSNERTARGYEVPFVKYILHALYGQLNAF